MEARLKIKQRDDMYRIYVTDALKYLIDNTAHYVGYDGLVDCGIHLNSRYAEIINPVEEEEEQEEEQPQTTQEIVSAMWERMKKGGKT